MAMNPGMKMLAMAKAAQGKQNRMGGGRQMRMGGYDRADGGGQMYGGTGRMGGNAEMTGNMEMRRRRDDRGRYMEGGGRMEYEGGSRMEDGGSSGSYWPSPHIPPYLDRPEGRSRRMEQDPSPMRDRNVVNIRDYQDRRQIGFATRMDGDDEEEEKGEREMRQYGRRYESERPSMHHGSSQGSRQHMGGAEGAGGDEHLTREDAEDWVRHMKSEDGKTGARWPYQEIKQYAGNFGIQGEEQVTEFFAVMNALYSDYCKVAKKHGVDKVDFWADLAKAFINDKDAAPGKVRMYYECIAKKDEE